MKMATDFFSHLVQEPPFRIFSKKFVKYLGMSVRKQALWDTSPRPNYLLGVLKAADQARDEGVPKILAIEFGVAAGNGLVALQDVAEAVERETGVQIEVVGFDSGAGMPPVPFDYRDHTDWWIPQDYPMDIPKLTARLKPRTRLVLGEVAHNARRFVAENNVPIGFVSFDLDYYSSTKDALVLLAGPQRKMLRRTPLYFDDIDFFFNHRFAGEYLAIDEFNNTTDGVRIDKWYGIKKERPFPEAPWLDKMFVAHDIAAVNQFRPARAARQHASFA
jgi:hypothetical protein